MHIYLKLHQHYPKVVIALLVTSIAIVAIMGKSAKATKRLHFDQISPNGVIDGQKNSESIPDQAAYMVFWNLVAYLHQSNPRAGLSYLAFHGFEDSDIKVIMSMSDTFKQKISALNTVTRELESKPQPEPPSTTARLNQLQSRQDDIVREVTDTLIGRLSQQGAHKLNSLVKVHIKSKMKIALTSSQFALTSSQ